MMMVAFCLIVLNAEEGNAQGKTQEYQASEIRIISSSARMFQVKNYLITSVMSELGGEGLPEVVRLGDRLTVNDRSLAVNHIKVTRCLERMEWEGQVLCERGGTRCLLVEREEDVPSDRGTHRLWVVVEKCAVIR
jgi:hypothetical protein